MYALNQYILRVKLWVSRTVSMKPNITLHIGTEKTGSTTIQHFLKDNRSILNTQGIYIPNTLGDINHQYFPFLAYSDEKKDDVTRRVRNIYQQQSRVKQKRSILKELRHEIKQNSNKNWIISSEYLQSRLTTPEDMHRLKELTDELFAEVSIVIYLRDPLKTAISMWSTVIKSGTSKFSLGKPGSCSHCDHQKILKRWLKVYNISQIKVRLFDKNKFIGGELINDFCDACKVINSDSMVKPPKENESISYKGIILLSQIFDYLKAQKPESIYPKLKEKPRLRHKFIRMIANHCQSMGRYIPTNEEISEWDEFYKPSENFVRENFFPEYDERLWEKYKSTEIKSSIESIYWTEETVKLLAESFMIILDR